MDHISKAELIAMISAEHKNFEDAVAGLSPEAMTEPGAEEQWSVKDIAAHLAFWEQRALFLLQCAKVGYREEKDRWRGPSVDARNEENFQAQRARSLGEVLVDLVNVQGQVLALLELTDEEAIFTPRHFPWLKSESLFESLTGETYEHYQEHMGSLLAWRAAHQ